ncbi:hypothetical protein SUGI_0209740 [Cryptomeria japonica]|uniref:putative calcium-binding protein CML19 n=1 Tax=Cryptomeria japonica TaxID=3369 RepID=UPI002408D360|nr:putative calcium-binding protein CML19 [Cryptomeria japonica]GLJ13287.1 hypothetical protein SUGI_0209740 [Cryptomeria japonica]
MADLNEIRRVYEMVDENADVDMSVSEICGFKIPLSEDDVRFTLTTSLQENCSVVRFVEPFEIYESILNIDHNKENETPEDLMEPFTLFDHHKDGNITSEDLQQCEQVICRFDLDCNGMLDFSEFKRMTCLLSRLHDE